MVDESRELAKYKIERTLEKMLYYLRIHNKVSVSTSGGSDSDIVTDMICTEFREFLPYIEFVFLNTGFEFEATFRHLRETEKKYGIKINEIKSTGVISAIKQEGFPIVSKRFSRDVYGAQRGWQSCIESLQRVRTRKQYGYSSTLRAIAKYLIDNNIPVSDVCCTRAKEVPLKRYQKECGADLVITGERRAEGGRRATAHNSCYEIQKTGADKFMPLYFWDNEVKQVYNKEHNIVNSECYTVYGMKRTGCCGCPFGSNVAEELEALKKYEPNKYKAVLNVFGESYRIMDKFNLHRKPIFQDQITFGDL